MKIDITLADKRGKPLFECPLERDFEEDSSLKSIVQYFKEHTAEIIPQVVSGSAQQYGNVLERLGMVRIMHLSFEWKGEAVVKALHLRS